MAKDKKFDTGMALSAGDSFRDLSKVFTNKLTGDINVDNEIAVRDLGGMISSPTALSLAIELYIKGLISLTKPKVSESHDLWALYNILPQELRNGIEQRYIELRDKAKKKHTIHSAELELEVSMEHITEDELNEWRKQNPRRPKTYELKDVLKRSKDTFTTWRYLHEVTDDIEVYEYEYTYLDMIAQSLREHLVYLLKQKHKNNERE